MKFPNQRLNFNRAEYELLKPGLDILANGFANAKLGVLPNRHPWYGVDFVTSDIYKEQAYDAGMEARVMSARSKLWNLVQSRKIRLAPSNLRPSHLPPGSEKIKNLHAIRLSFRRKCDFTMSGSGMSLKKIAKQLNDDGVPPPRETKKKIRSSWVYTAIREMLRRDLYRGCVVWNKRKFKKRPGTNKRISVLRPECDWVTREEPALRIVTDEL